MAPTYEFSTNQTNSSPKDFQEFDERKTGVKGLVDSGISKIPEFFVHHQEISLKASDQAVPCDLQVPVIDLQSIDKDEASYKQIVQEVLEASVSWGVFQVVNHGVVKDELENVIEKVKEFHEGNKEVKEKLYNRDQSNKVRFLSNLSHLQSGAATWRDTLVCVFDGTLDPTQIPLVCRETIMKYKEGISRVVEILYELLSVALGLPPDYMKARNYDYTKPMFMHYYPPCPEPELTIGVRMHTDPTFITVLLQDDLGGLQVLHDGYLVDVTPVPGALVVNIGDLLKCFSNDKLKSTEHHVLASKRGPRISVATCITPALDSEKPFGPLKLLLSDENPPLHQEFLIPDYVKTYLSKEPNNSVLSYYKI
ncbi:1-aminocyclopropane-1-carboxylate oxidase 1-like isoform X1 [Carex littledalei]|uniref:1-aminocyclopropane-1-carboxylate oxidase 1-like isoform X1 n=1 Tax=Carex littledalei TaxID=544730 RepID=A0A833R395_9POAL|nr:1-aminocyclopropane-1-carboxylate oxidase 1-like isoform X1 [Carex littledalei]